MCESTVYLDDDGELREVMEDVTRIVVDGPNVKLTNIIGEQIVLEGARFKEANLLSHGLVFERI